MTQAFVNWHGHNLILTYQDADSEVTYSAGMHQVDRMLDRILSVPAESMISFSAPQEFFDKILSGLSAEKTEKLKNLLPLVDELMLVW